MSSNQIQTTHVICGREDDCYAAWSNDRGRIVFFFVLYVSVVNLDIAVTFEPEEIETSYLAWLLN